MKDSEDLNDTDAFIIDLERELLKAERELSKFPKLIKFPLHLVYLFIFICISIWVLLLYFLIT